MKNSLSAMSNSDLLKILCGSSARSLAGLSLLEVFGFKQPKQMEMSLCEERAEYMVQPQIAAAKELYLRAMHEQLETASCFANPDAIKVFLRGKLSHLEHEVFVCLFLDTQNRLLHYEVVFTGSILSTTVHPREIVKRALALNASAVVLGHNHPSGSTQPSRADETLTNVLKSALALVDVRTLDHIIVGSDNALSMAERGLM